MSKVISHHTKNIKLYLNLASYSSWNHYSECKLVVEVFSYHMLPAWVIHQIVSRAIFLSGPFNWWWLQSLIFPNTLENMFKIWNIWNIHIMEYLIHCVQNVNSLILCKLPILFSTVKLNIGPKLFPNSQKDFRIFECCSGRKFIFS